MICDILQDSCIQHDTTSEGRLQRSRERRRIRQEARRQQQQQQHRRNGGCMRNGSIVSTGTDDSSYTSLSSSLSCYPQRMNSIDSSSSASSMMMMMGLFDSNRSINNNNHHRSSFNSGRGPTNMCITVGNQEEEIIINRRHNYSCKRPPRCQHYDSHDGLTPNRRQYLRAAQENSRRLFDLFATK